MNDLIYYYSGTGNTYASANQLAKLLGESYVCLPIQRNTLDLEADTVIFIFPVYAYGLPKFIYKLFKNINIKAQRVILLSTCGSVSGHFFKQAYKLLTKRGVRISYCNHIDCVENYFAIFKQNTIEEEKTKITNQEKFTKEIAEQIRSRVTTDIPNGSVSGCFISAIFRTFLPVVNLGIRVHKKDCTGCGLCVKNCQIKAIKVVDGKAKIHPSQCQNCQGCVNICPKKAISFMKIKKSTRRYIHPDHFLMANK